MASILQAYHAYGPGIERGRTVDLDEMARFMALSTGLDRCHIRMVLGKIHDTILHYARQGRGVYIEDVVTLWPVMSTRGAISLGWRISATLRRALNALPLFRGRINNYEHRDWATEDYRQAWDQDHPDDPIKR